MFMLHIRSKNNRDSWRKITIRYFSFALRSQKYCTPKVKEMAFYCMDQSIVIWPVASHFREAVQTHAGEVSICKKGR